MLSSQFFLMVASDNCLLLPPAGLSEENKVLTPAFTDALRLYRQAKGHYGTWDMLCGDPARVSPLITANVQTVLSIHSNQLSFLNMAESFVSTSN